jgi:hypothetical protein
MGVKSGGNGNIWMQFYLHQMFKRKVSKPCRSLIKTFKFQQINGGRFAYKARF